MMSRKTCFSRSCSTIALLAISMLVGVAHAAQRELKEVRVAYPPSMASVTLMTGIKQKFFEEQGLNLTLLVIASDLALKSQVAGEIDYTLFGGGTGMVAAAQGLPIRVVHLPHKFADLTLVARPEFKTVAQLRGKKVAVSSFSGAVYSSTRAMLAAGGLDPDKDVVMIPMGREPIRLQALLAGKADVVYGSRYLAHGKHAAQSWSAYLGGRSLSVIGLAFTGRYLTDTVTALKLFRRSAIASLPLETSGFELDHEITSRMLARGATIAEVPIRYSPRSRAEGKKIGLRDWFIAVRTFWRYRRG